MGYINDNLRELRRLHGHSQKEVADVLKVNRVTISRYENGESIPLDKVEVLSSFYDVPIDHLLYHDIVKEPPGTYLITGTKNVLRLDKPISKNRYRLEHWQFLPDQTERGDLWAAIRVAGSEMLPTAHPGSIVVGEKMAEGEFVDDGLYLLVLSDKSVVFRQVRRESASNYVLISHNTSFKDRIVKSSEIVEWYRAQRVFDLKWV